MSGKTRIRTRRKHKSSPMGLKFSQWNILITHLRNARIYFKQRIQEEIREHENINS